MRRHLVPLIVLPLAVAGLWVGAAPASAASAVCLAAYSAPDNGGSPQDIDGDGCADLVVGVPTATNAGATQAGVIDIHYDAGIAGTPVLAPQRIGESFFTGMSAHAGDHFGAALTYPDFVNEGQDHQSSDVAVSAPDADGGRGAVIVAHGSSHGVSPTGAVRITGTSAGEHFGAAIAAEGEELWVAAPDRSVDGQEQAGAVDHYHLNSDGTVSFVETVHQGAGGIGGSPETGDHFGSVLSMANYALAIGIPDEDVGTAKDAGMVTFLSMKQVSGSLRAGTSTTFEQNTRGIVGVAEAGDHFGAALALDSVHRYLAVGVPDEDVGPVKDAGFVQLIGFTDEGTVYDVADASQASPTVSGVPEAGDHFGASLLIAGFVGQPTASDDDFAEALAVGVPGEDVGTVRDAGIVQVLSVSQVAKDSMLQLGATLYRGGSGPSNLSGHPTAGDEVGAGLAPVALPDIGDFQGGSEFGGGALLAVIIPGQDAGATDAGSISVLRYNAPAQQLGDSAGPIAGERYGVAPNTWSNGPTEDID